MGQIIVKTDFDRYIRSLELENERLKEDIKKEKEKRQQDNFIRINDPDGILAIKSIYNINKSAGDLFSFMMQFMDRKNCLVCSRILLSEAINKSIPTIARAINILEKNNYILISKVGTTNAYHLNSSICWKSWESGRKYAKLSGTVLLSLNEQDKGFQNKIKKQMQLFSEKNKNKK
jgi:hypothetical protein